MERSNKPVEVVETQKVTEPNIDSAYTPEAMLLDMIPEPKKEEAKSIIKAMVVMQEESFSGPIPPPAILKQYEEMQPGSADRILKMAEKQSEHRMELEKKAIGGQVDQSKRGQVFGFILALVCIAVAFCFALFLDMKAFASGFLSVTLVVLVGLFLNGKVSMGKDLREKSKDQDK